MAQAEGKRESRERRQEGVGYVTAMGGLFIADVEAACQSGRSAKAVSEAQITETGCPIS